MLYCYWDGGDMIMNSNTNKKNQNIIVVNGCDYDNSTDS